MILFIFLVATVSGGLIVKRSAETVECDIVPVTNCTVKCGGGFQLMKYACVEETANCGCPTNPIYYQCNNRPCLGKNSTLLDTFYDEENKQQEEAGVEYVEEDVDVPITKKST